MATQISHKVEESRTPLSPYLANFPKFYQFLTPSLKQYSHIRNIGILVFLPQSYLKKFKQCKLRKQCKQCLSSVSNISSVNIGSSESSVGSKCRIY